MFNGKRNSTIPMVDDDWPVTDLPTVASCDAAEVILRDAIASIETSLATARDKAPDGAWLHRVKTALRFRRAAMRIVQETRAKLLLSEKQEASA